MMKKVISNALLSLFMDKSAREKLRHRAPRKAPIGAPLKREDTASASPPGHHRGSSPKLPTKHPKAPVATPNTPPPPRGEDPHAPLDEKLNAAKRVLNSERHALIRSALQIQRSQAKILNDLDKEDRERLRAIALNRLAPPRGND